MRFLPATLTAFLFSTVLPSWHPAAADSTFCTPVVGFGRNATGGQGSPVFTVTNLNDSGQGSLRDALSKNNRHIKFGVSGTIDLQSTIYLDGASNITIDGYSAPGDGITIDAVSFRSSFADAIIFTNSNNIIVRGIRIQNAGNDNLQITSSSNIVVTHNTFVNSVDGALDITIGVSDVTVSWNIIADTYLASLFKYNNPQRFTVHNNLYTGTGERNPVFEDVTDFDFFNNVIYDWLDSGAQVRETASGNVIGNYFIPTRRGHASLWKTGTPQFYLAGFRPNVDPSSIDEFPNVLPSENWDRAGAEDWASFMAGSAYDFGYPVTYTTAEQALSDVLRLAGPKNRTAQEQGYVNEVIDWTGVNPGSFGCDIPRLFDDSFEDLPPSVPTNVAAVAVSSTGVELSWDPSSDPLWGVDHYNVYRDGIKVGESADVDFSDVGLEPSTTYSYQVSAVNGTMVESDPSSPAVQATTFLPPVVAHWTFEEGGGNTTADVTGAGHDGTLVNGADWTSGTVGSHAIMFDGADDYVDVGNLDIGGNAMTLSAWFRVDVQGCQLTDCRLLSKASGTGEQEHFFMLSTVASDGAQRLRFRLKTDGNTDTLIGDDGAVSNGRWYHVVGVYDGTEMILYQDAVVVGRKAKTGDIDVDPSVETWIGSNPPSATSRPWAGHLDDVRIYGRALSEAEVIDLYNE